MGDFLNLAWRAETLGVALAARAREAALCAGMTPLRETACSWFGVGGPRPPALQGRGDEDVWLVGDLYDCDRIPGRSGEPDAHRFAALCRLGWGRYIAVGRDPDGRVRSLFRDPSGALEAFVWSVDSLQVVTSASPDWLISAANPNARIEIDRLAVLVGDPSAIVGDIALSGVQACGPGEMLQPDRRERVELWRPDAAAAFEGSAEEAASGLRAQIDRSVRRLSSRSRNAVAELSGGLDSAIVAKALRSAGAPVRTWVNSYTARPESDERTYARTMAEHLKVELTTQERDPSAFDAAAFEATAGEPRPSLNGQDVGFDQMMAAVCHRAEADTLFTGKGGDAVFFHALGADVFADLWRQQGPASVLSPLLPGLARWTRTSAWSILRRTIRPAAGAPAKARAASVLRPELRSEGFAHPWLQDIEGLPPAKRRHVAAVVGNLAFQSRCRRNSVVDMIHPLTAQPVVEFCLGLPTPVLALGARDRGLARLAFAERLPPEIADRRSKGDYTTFFNREIAHNRVFLRDYLLGGRLSDLGLIDRPALEASLEPDRLIWLGGPPDLSRALVVESWVRRWEARLGGR